MNILREDREPAYHRIKREILAKIRGSEWAVGTQIPAEPVLQHDHGASRGTIRHALLELEMEGYILRQQGKGTFVASASPRMAYQLGEMGSFSFSEQVRRADCEPSAEVLERVWKAAAELDQEASDVLKISVSAGVFVISRLRYADRDPIALHRVYLPANRFPGILEQDLSSSLIRVYRDTYGVRISSADETLRIGRADASTARSLKLASGARVFIRERISYDGVGLPFEQLHAIEKPEKFEYRYHLVKDETSIRQQQVPTFPAAGR